MRLFINCFTKNEDLEDEIQRRWTFHLIGNVSHKLRHVLRINKRSTTISPESHQSDFSDDRKYKLLLSESRHGTITFEKVKQDGRWTKTFFVIGILADRLVGQFSSSGLFFTENIDESFTLKLRGKDREICRSYLHFYFYFFNR